MELFLWGIKGQVFTNLWPYSVQYSVLIPPFHFPFYLSLSCCFIHFHILPVSHCCCTAFINYTLINSMQPSSFAAFPCLCLSLSLSLPFWFIILVQFPFFPYQYSLFLILFTVYWSDFTHLSIPLLYFLFHLPFFSLTSSHFSFHIFLISLPLTCTLVESVKADLHLLLTTHIQDGCHVYPVVISCAHPQKLTRCMHCPKQKKHTNFQHCVSNCILINYCGLLSSTNTNSLPITISVFKIS